MQRDPASVFWLSVLALGVVVIGSGWPIYHQEFQFAQLLGWSTFIVGCLGALAGVVGMAILAREHRLAFPRPPRPHLHWPLTFSSQPRASPDAVAENQGPTAPWVNAVIDRDGADLKGALHQMSERQYGNVAFNLEHPHEPSIVIAFWYVNASIYTIVFQNLEGPLQVEGEAVSGHWKFDNYEVAHNRVFLIKLKWVITTETSKQTLRELLESGKSIHVNLDAVKLRIGTKEDTSIASEVRFLQQWWQPREEAVANLVTLSFEVTLDGRDVVLRGVVDNNSDLALGDVQVRVDKSELCGMRQSDGQPVWHDYAVPQVMLPWVPEDVTTKDIGPKLSGSRLEVARLPDNTSIASVPGGERHDGLIFTEAGCHRLTVTMFANNWRPRVETIEFRIAMGNSQGEKILIGKCECD